MKRRRPFSSRPFVVESLESRNLMAAAVVLDHHVLNVQGTTHNDDIAIVNQDIHFSNGYTMHAIQVTVKNRDSGDVLVQKSVNAASVDKIMVQCFDGDDVATNSTSKPSTMYGGPGSDDLNGGSGNDILYAADEFNGADQRPNVIDIVNVLNGGGGSDTLYGSKANDILSGGDGGDALYGGDGNDELNGGKGNDGLYGGDGDDKLDGGAGKDVLYGEKGNDIVSGGSGNDLVDGGDGDDFCEGGAGTDTVAGGSGFDHLFGDQIYSDPDPHTKDTLYYDLLDDFDGHSPRHRCSIR